MKPKNPVQDALVTAGLITTGTLVGSLIRSLVIKQPMKVDWASLVMTILLTAGGEYYLDSKKD